MSSLPLGSTIGIIGGGQLGKMMALAAAEMGYLCHIYSDKEDSPAFFHASSYTKASYEDKKQLVDFANKVDIITFEFENIPHKSLELLHHHNLVRPSVKALFLSQNRIREKQYFESLGFQTAPWRCVKDRNSLIDAYTFFDGPSILKTTEFGYDGKGQITLDNTDTDQLERIWHSFSSDQCILEQKINFDYELSVVGTRNAEGQIRCFDCIENRHHSGILQSSAIPSQACRAIKDEAIRVASTIMDDLNYIGTLAVEFFVTSKKELLINEFAPRPHNSGHLTIDCCYHSQFGQHIRAICGLPLGNTECHTPAVMTNLIGDEIKQVSAALNNPFIKLHLYGKKRVASGRKMGHITELLPQGINNKTILEKQKAGH